MTAKKKIVTVVGARPQFVKAAAVSRAFARQSGVEEVLIHTGQHYDFNMSQVFFDELGIPKPQVNLDVGSGSHGEQTAAMILGLEKSFLELKPDWVLVYGDTNSTLAGSLAAAKMQIPVAHVEAGLRSFNRAMPEEINRIVTDHLSQILFCPTLTAQKHLLDEGIESARVHLVGDVMLDAFNDGFERAQKKRAGFLKEVGAKPGEYLLATVHRAENTDRPARLKVILESLAAMAAKHQVIWPVHPRTRKILKESSELTELSEKLLLLEPVGYLEMILLEKSARLIATDSGGVQKEAYFAGVPCVTLRSETEWTELIEAGWNRLANPVNTADVGAAFDAALKATATRAGAGGTVLYGDGFAAEKIVQVLA